MRTISRLTGAVLRAILTMVLIATPALLLPGIGADAKQVAALAGLLLGAFVLVEYGAANPTLLEFRHAPPINRLKYLSLFAMLASFSLMARHEVMPSVLSGELVSLGRSLAALFDGAWSPFRLAIFALGSAASPVLSEFIRLAMGLGVLIAGVTIAGFALLLHFGQWPPKDRALNLWSNMPTFEPTSGRDIVLHLEKDSKVNLILGIILPFLLPALLRLFVLGETVQSVSNAQVVIWAVAAWCFLPVTLILRGMALGRIAAMIRNQRAAEAREAKELATA